MHLQTSIRANDLKEQVFKRFFLGMEGESIQPFFNQVSIDGWDMLFLEYGHNEFLAFLAASLAPLI